MIQVIGSNEVIAYKIGYYKVNDSYYIYLIYNVLGGKFLIKQLSYIHSYNHGIQVTNIIVIVLTPIMSG